jgi:hypothetical protein
VCRGSVWEWKRADRREWVSVRVKHWVFWDCTRLSWVFVSFLQ